MQVSNPVVRPATTMRRPLFPAGHLLPFFLVTALFFLWGIPNNLNDVLIRQFMKSFAITRFQAASLGTRLDLSLDCSSSAWVRSCSGRPQSPDAMLFSCSPCS